MAQLLANELLIMTFKELLNETSFEYMNSIYLVCKKWKKLIELVLIEEIEFRLKSKLLIEYGFSNCSTQNISYDFSNSAFNIFIDGNHSKLYFSNIPENIEKKKTCTRRMYINFKYENSKEYLVEFNLGTLLFIREKNLHEKYEIKSNIEWNYEDYHYNPYFSNIPENIEKRKIFVNFQYKNNENNEFLVELNLGTLLFFFEKYEIKSEIEWNHKDCMCIYTKEFITIEKLIISLKKMCIILDILDEEEYLVEFNLGTLLFYEERNSNEMMEVKYSIEWNYKDCTCISKKDSQYDYFGIIIKIEKLIISLKKMCVILDLLDEKLNTKDYQYKYIIKRPTFDIDDFVCDFSHFTLEL
ncbi:15684_t:CDS:2 [Rhizophagus irregularis]|nr:15684_t:CDS:2 [Rhizophagus irregularis]